MRQVERRRRSGSATMTIEELAKVLGCGRNTVYQAARDGALPVPLIRIGRRLLVSRLEVDRLLGRIGTAGDQPDQDAA